MQIPKEKRVKLKGKALKELNDNIHERDNNKCILCGAAVDCGIKFHHEPFGCKKSDEINKGVTLCNDCHFKRHFDRYTCIIKRDGIKEYLKNIYG